jgi:hypothetical protein
MIERALYRSPHLPPGTFRQVGVMHIHIDGAGYEDLVNSLVRDLENRGARAKLTAVNQAVGGPQREEEPETYASHTPGSLDMEHLEYFSTSTLHNRTDAVNTLAEIIPKMSGHAGVVIEVERVIAKIDEKGWRALPVKDKAITGADVGFDPSPTLPFEIHHAMDFAAADGAETATPPLTPQELLAETVPLGLRVGGWFNFVKTGGLWSFRSNAFTSAPEQELQSVVTKQYDLLGNYVARKGLQCRRWAIVEQVIGIWRSPFAPLS